MQDVFYPNKIPLDTLANIKKSGRICHAYLITGDNGLGKKTFASLFAKTLLCSSPLNGLACGNCKSCLKANAGTHPDITVISGTGAKDSIHISKIRQLKQDAYIMPNESDYRIFIIQNAENMSQGAVNAILKVLEEPPENTLFLLTAPSPSSLPDTIVSRCIEIRLSPLSEETLLKALTFITPDSELAKSVAARAGGNLGLAKEILSGKDYLKHLDIAQNILKTAAEGYEYDLLAAFAQCPKGREELKSVFRIILDIIREAISVKNGGISQGYEVSENLALSMTNPTLLKTANIMLDAYQNIDKNANIALLLSCTAAKIKY